MSAIHYMDDLYVVFLGFGKYEESMVFDALIKAFFAKSSFIRRNIQEFIDDSRFSELSRFIVQSVVRTDLIASEIVKYNAIKKYCVVGSSAWQNEFKAFFLEFVTLQKMDIDFLLSTVKDDDVVSAESLLEVISQQRATGFDDNNQSSSRRLTADSWNHLTCLPL